MYIMNDVVYAENFKDKELKIIDFKVISELCMLVTFSNGEKRIFDATPLMVYPIYKKLEDYNIFKNAYLEKGIIVWESGDIDISTEVVYKNSFEYEQKIEEVV